MKKSLHLIVLTLCLFLFSCKKDKNSGASASIIGKWNVTSIVVTAYNKDGNVVDTDPDSGRAVSLTFNSDGTALSESRDGNVESFTYTINITNGKKIVKIVGDPDDSTQNEEYEIITLTEHSMALKSTITEDIDPAYGKVTIDIKLAR